LRSLREKKTLREKQKPRTPVRKGFTRRIAAEKHAAARSGKENAAYRRETFAIAA